MKSIPWRRLAAAFGLALGGAATQAQNLTVVTESTPLSYLQEGRVVGRATEVVETTLKRAAITDYRIDLYPWARAQDIALREPYVLIYPIARTPEREERFRWVGEIKRIQYYLFALTDGPEQRIAQLDDARGRTIGVVRDDVRHQYLQRRGFTRLAVSSQPMENLRKLLYRQVDLIVLTESEARTLCAEARGECPGLVRGLPLDELRYGLYMAYSLATPEAMATRTAAAFESMRADGSLARIMAAPASPGATSATPLGAVPVPAARRPGG